MFKSLKEIIKNTINNSCLIIKGIREYKSIPVVFLLWGICNILPSIITAVFPLMFKELKGASAVIYIISLVLLAIICCLASIAFAGLLYRIAYYAKNLNKAYGNVSFKWAFKFIAKFIGAFFGHLLLLSPFAVIFYIGVKLENKTFTSMVSLIAVMTGLLVNCPAYFLYVIGSAIEDGISIISSIKLLLKNYLVTMISFFLLFLCLMLPSAAIVAVKDSIWFIPLVLLGMVTLTPLFIVGITTVYTHITKGEK